MARKCVFSLVMELPFDSSSVTKGRITFLLIRTEMCQQLADIIMNHGVECATTC